ncbi:M48 family metalloprotease [Actinosynnema sp. NPDC020468]|uniref:M48 family metalloprotease n=1 Tax=Actinosynnema sp. NPDC020468 TaxID=3154488 RepID=UPI003401CED6
MTATAPAGVDQDDAGTPPGRPPVRGGSWWVYAVVFVALATTGAGAGEAFFTAHDVGDSRAIAVCLAGEGISVDTPPEVLVFAEDLFTACVRDSHRLLTVVTLAGAAALLLAAWSLVLLGGALIRWRLRPSRVADVPADAARRLTERFTTLCDKEGLVGRARPHLVIAPPATGVREAFTTALPGTPPRVVVPLSYSHTDQAAFDAVALHELGHVRSRDVTWASAVWWTGWLAVPALLVTITPLLTSSEALWSLHGLSLVVAVISAVSVLVLRAALLRRREFAADRHAVEATGDPTALQAMLTSRRPVVRTGVRARATTALRKAFATHPTTTERLDAGPGDWSPGHGGFLFAAVTGVVAMRLYHGLDAVLGDLLGHVEDFSKLPETVSLAVAALLWAAVMIPPWTRRAALSAPRWAAPRTGAVLGLVVGYCVKPPGATQIVVSFYGRNLLLLAAALAVATTAVVVLTTGIAAGLATRSDGRRGRLAAVAATITAAAALTAAAGAATALVDSSMTTLRDVAAVRVDLLGLGAAQPWRYLGPVILAGLVLLVLRTRPPRVGVVSLVVVPVAAVTGGVGASLSWLTRAHDGRELTAQAVMVYERWWICAFAGLVATAVVLLAERRRPPAPLPEAVLGGLLATCLAGGVQYVVLGLAGTGRQSSLVDQTLRSPGWLFAFSSLVLLPLVALVTRLPARHGVRRRVGWWTGSTVGAVALLTAALLTGSLSRVTVDGRDFDHAETLIGASEIPDLPHAPPSGREHGHPLDDAAANAALDRLPALLPPTARVVPVPDSERTATDPATCADEVGRFTAAEKAMDRTAASERGYEFLARGIPLGVTLSVTVTSYATPWTDLSGIDGMTRACANFREASAPYDGGSVDGSWVPRAAPDTPFDTRRRALTLTGRIRDFTVVTTVHHHIALTGHNVIDVGVFWGRGHTPPPRSTTDRLDRLAEDVVDTVVASL